MVKVDPEVESDRGTRPVNLDTGVRVNLTTSTLSYFT